MLDVSTRGPVSTPTPTTSPARPSASLTKPASPQGIITAFHEVDLVGLFRLLSMRPPMDWAHALRIASLFPSALNQSIYNGLERLLYGRAAARTELVAPPVFVIGHWRSGTTLLQSLLQMDDQLVTPNLGEVFFGGNFLTTNWFLCPLTSWILPKTRPQDNIPVGWKEPQEDEIAMLGLTLYSPYLMLAFHHRREAFWRFYEVETMKPHEQAEWKRVFVDFLKRLTYRHQKRLMLKSPSNTFRIKTFLEMFPGCKFIYIYRDPYDTFVSSVHLRRTLIPQYSLSTIDHSKDEEECLNLYEETFKVYERDRHLIPQGDLYELKYENLAAEPLDEMRKIYSQLSLPGWDALEPKIAAYVPTVKSFKKNKFVMDEAIMRQVYPRCKQIFERFGYDPRLPDA